MKTVLLATAGAAAVLWAIPAFAAAPAEASKPPAAASKGGVTASSTNVATIRRTQLPPILSPEVLPDRRVTFRLRAPEAKDVTVSGEWTNGVKQMTMDSLGVWSITLGPLAPDLYGYNFSIDGFQTLDPANPAVKPMRSPRTSILDVPGPAPLPHDFQNVPHGTVRQHAYASKALGKRRDLVVYTPPGYDRDPASRFPVLYLFHGSGDNEATWTTFGRAHWTTDNLLAQGKCRPMIIVMTDGHAAPQAPPNAPPEERSRNLVAFQNDLLGDVMPFVEAHYRTRPGVTNRAIVGLSMGGGQALNIGLNHPELFAWIGGMSSSVPNPEESMKGALGDAAATNGKLKLLWIACGKEDFLLKQNTQFDALLTARGVQHEFKLTEGNHSWPVWRRYLVDFLPRIFTVE